MQSFSMLFKSEKDLRQSTSRLLKKHGVTGEIEIKPLAGGEWLLQVFSEKNLRESTIENLAGKRIEADSGELGRAGT